MTRIRTFLVLAAVTAGFIFAGFNVANAQPKAGRGHGPGMGQGPVAGGMGPGMGNLMALPDLSEKQMSQILDLQKDMQLKHFKLHQQRFELMEEMQTLVEDPDANRTRLGQIEKELSEMNLVMDKDRVAQEEMLKNILTDDQWEELAVRKAERRNEMSDEDFQGRGRGRAGMRQGFGQGSCGQGPGFNGSCPLPGGYGMRRGR
ncbi:hypothetical protein KQI52_06010 [bacterium]|nr:hypothetical protein [bacterium]